MRRGLRQLCISFWFLSRAHPPLNSTEDLLSQVQLNMQIHMGSPFIVLRTEAFLGIFSAVILGLKIRQWQEGKGLVKDVCH